MKFSPEDMNTCIKLFKSNSSTKEVQDHLMQKYQCKRSSTSDFIKKTRKKMGVYKPLGKS